MSKIVKLSHILCLLFSSTAICAQTILTINTTGKPPLNNKEQTGFMDLIAQEAFQRVGYRIKTAQLPAERGLKNVNLGIEDGEMSRIKGLENSYANLVRVPERIMQWEFVGFSKKSLTLKDGWKSLSNHTVSFINGWKILERNVPKDAFVTKVRTSEQLFTLLKKNRIEIVLYERWGGLLFTQSPSYSDVKLLSPPLAIKEMFIYLNKKHSELVPKLNNALISMKQDGTYQSIMDKVLRHLEER